MVPFLAKLNGLCSWGTDIGNAHLEAFAKKQVYIIAGPEFGPLQVHALIINKDLCRLRTSDIRCYKKLSYYLRDLGHEP